ncbi:adenosylcobinamide-phosphate synthase CbiB [Parabacteroides sp. PF5-9]|uniref:adenosylcobinamide-phosphate synthase CbiB n=1 Tax=Parabacteroides sp. PF5-9 TaxID=1742404 RepID=UPI002472F214|nr:adenosylcobinamide-phosphate synthase CbiB [Parabacteroides sp. PF5-9]MDH6357378.1 adenosylcobinamide-phosphate synthase [Parabacteroides sp. PF5-9]
MFWPFYTNVYLLKVIPFIGGWLADRLLGDPEKWPHPVVLFGKLIAAGEKEFNKGKNKVSNGGLMAAILIVSTFGITDGILMSLSRWIDPLFTALLTGIGVFFCLSGKTLINEVKGVFEAVNRNTEEGRIQLSRIVGRDTSCLTPQEIRTAALESLAENLSDGVIAPMFWFAVLGLPGMMAYKMINTLDSMIGYKNERYLEFGRIAAQLDDIANYIPARMTAYLMLLVSGCWDKRSFIQQYGRAHTSPNAGYPEAAMAAILDCRFGGAHDYFGEEIEKPYIGTNDRLFTDEDLVKAVQVNSHTELLMGIVVLVFILLNPLWHI